jgi:hypothetical protein
MEAKYFMDSSCILGKLQIESCRFYEFTGIRMSEIKVKSDVLRERYWIYNPTDLETRDATEPEGQACITRK